MCSASKPKLSPPKPILPEPPPEEVEIQVGGSTNDAKNRRKRAAMGTRQLMIPTQGSNPSGGSGLGIP